MTRSGEKKPDQFAESAQAAAAPPLTLPDPHPPLPVFDLDRCQATGFCVAACPTQCLELWNDQPGLLRPSDCVSCAICVLICPTDAVDLPPIPEP